MNVRGLFPSLGAGGSLIAAVLCAAALFGGTLAFRGEAGGTAEANSGVVTLPSRTVRAQTTSSGLVETVLTLVTVGRQTPRGDARRRPRPRRQQTAATPRQETAPRVAITPRATAPAAPPPAQSTPAPDPVTGTVERAVEQVHAVADPVIQQVPDPAEHHAESLTETVDQVAQTVDETANNLLP
jgi:hypothetical protein